ncbi:hypothetical protein ATK17_2038 [Branchiibius hedensis]|uniref:SH3 domain-containing protein n=2 Tax=Branchiibius hedensis TaxID=672460 RepID=A0A2Y9C1P7_9MICO|nr:hypothetical protein ATK17_2038 [Branchiibius hedensis]SSA34713.1 hypothetical protein SAMN04489750_2038 [Branchiibius hedensis]
MVPMRRHAAQFAVVLASAIGITSTAVPTADAWRPPRVKACGATADDKAFAAKLSPTIHSAGLSGVSADQVACARQILAEVKAEGFSSQAGKIALMTAITETGLRNYLGGDRDSLGLFQQRPSMGWGTRAQIIRPAYSTHKFLSAMVKRYPHGSWATADPGRVAQSVQRSAYPSRYNRERTSAARLVAVLWAGTPATPAPAAPSKPAKPTKPTPTSAALALVVPGGGIRVRSGATTAAKQVRFLKGHSKVTATCQRLGKSVKIGSYRSAYWSYLPAQKGYVSNAAMHRNGGTALKAC